MHSNANPAVAVEENAEDGDEFLRVDDLRVEYSSEGETIYAVNGCSFSLRRGESLGLVGETGAGKTTIAKAIMGILPDVSARVRSGSVVFDGEDLLRKDDEEMRRIRGQRISMIFQDPMTALNPVIRVGDQIAEVIKLHTGLRGDRLVARAKDMLELVGISADRFREYPHQFSGGMKQRVVIAMALACEPELLLADEPTSALDVTIQAQVLDMIKKLREDFNTSMILITHDLGIVASTCDKVGVIYAGELVEYGSTRDIFNAPSHPYTRGLFGAIPDINVDVERLTPILGTPPDPTRRPSGCSFFDRCPVRIGPYSEDVVPFTEVSDGHHCRCCVVQERLVLR